MKVGLVAHGALLAAALVFSYQSWTREPDKDSKVGEHAVWNEAPEAFASLTFDGDGKSVKIERRGEGDGRYLWGSVTRTSTKPKAGAAADPHAGIPGAPPVPGAPAAKPTEAGAKPAPAAPPSKATPAPAAPPTKATPAPAAPTPAPAAPTPPTGGPAKALEAQAPPPVSGGGMPAFGATPPDDGHGHGADDGHGHGAGDEPGAAPVETETVTTVREFPVGPDGDALIANFSQLRALRDLGVLDEEKKTELGLDKGTENLSVFFAGGKTHSLVVGARVFGGSDRYVLDPESGKGYVISTEIMKPIDGAETSLSLKEVHAFEADSLDKLEVDATGFAKKSLVKKTVEDDKGKQTGWADAGKGDAPDQTLTNFVSQVDKLKPTEYDSKLDPSGLEKLLVIGYLDAKGKSIGSFELYKRPAAAAPPTTGGKAPGDDYFVKTELTRVLGKVSRMAAERLVSNDLPQLFGQAPKDPPKPKEAPADKGVPAGLAAPGAVSPGTGPTQEPPKPGGRPQPSGGMTGSVGGPAR